MKNIAAVLKARLATVSLSMCQIMEITRTDGMIYRFTDHDVDVPVDGVDFTSEASFTPTNIIATGRGSVGSFQIDTYFKLGAFAEDDVRTGVFDGARVKVWAVDWKDPTFGRIPLFNGSINEVKYTNEKVARITCTGMLGRFVKMLGEKYSANCRAILGDERCRVDIESMKLLGTVATATANRIQLTALDVGLVAKATDWATLGVVLWATGLNAGTSLDVLKHTLAPAAGANPARATIKLYEIPPRPITVGDTFWLYPGCNKILLQDCKLKFNNVLNFRGEPHVPTADYQGQTPIAGS